MEVSMNNGVGTGNGVGSIAQPKWLAGLRADYELLFVESWSPYVGAVLMVLIIAVLMVSGLFWGIYGGLKLWGDWLNWFLGLGPALNIKSVPEDPLLHRMSLMNMTLVLGAFTAALMSRQFAFNRAPRLEYVWGAVGGTLMGVGATLAGGCTTGGFFTPAMHSSPAGWAMWAGLLLGALVGLKLLLWTMEHIQWGTKAPIPSQPPLRAWHPLLGLVLLIALGVWVTTWANSENEKIAARAIVVLCGFAMGFVLHRSRICFARAFREPFMTAEGDMTKAIILALAIAIPLASLLFQRKVIDPYLGIPATFWIGSLSGGVIFGIGMVFAGGCASGALWRVGEGHLKLWVAVLFFAWAGSTFSGILKYWNVMAVDVNLDGAEFTKVGVQAYLPSLIGGWEATYLFGFAILLLWYLWVRYNESTEKFTIL
jgi:uncharacterized membrane protein YedE/YeeE